MGMIKVTAYIQPQENKVGKERGKLQEILKGYTLCENTVYILRKC